MLRVDELIHHSQDKGIKFNIISDKDAKEYLNKNNNYFKLTSYRKNYSKKTNGVNIGKYEKLDFAFLIELARIDVELRHILLNMCLDIEHFLKVALIKAVEDNLADGVEDGYKIVENFILAKDETSFKKKSEVVSRRSGSISRKINQNQKNPYCEGLINSYSSEMPIWTFVELISFGDLTDLIAYYSNTTAWVPPVDCQSLDRVRQIRNAAAHSNCIINDLRSSTDSAKTPRFITQFVTAAGISKHSRTKKLSNKRINQIVHLLYIYDIVVVSENTRQTRLQELNNLIDIRMLTHREYFADNLLLTSTYDFFKKIVNYISSRH